MINHLPTILTDDIICLSHLLWIFIYDDDNDSVNQITDRRGAQNIKRPNKK